jgi:hypothetical protein
VTVESLVLWTYKENFRAMLISADRISSWGEAWGGGGKVVPKVTFKPFKTICTEVPRVKFHKLVACGLPMVRETISISPPPSSR